MRPTLSGEEMKSSKDSPLDLFIVQYTLECSRQVEDSTPICHSQHDSQQLERETGFDDLEVSSCLQDEQLRSCWSACYWQVLVHLYVITDKLTSARPPSASF